MYTLNAPCSSPIKTLCFYQIFYRAFPLVVILMTALVVPGCQEGRYQGASLSIPVEKVVLFEIAGPNGKELTPQLGTAFNGMGISIAYGNEYGEPVDSIAAAKITRDCQAQAFVMGEITKSELVKLSTYEIHGTFTLHDAQNGDQIGGIADAMHSEDIDILSELTNLTAGVLDFAGDLLGGPKDKPNERKNAEKIKKVVDEKTPAMRQKFAHYVARQLSMGLSRSPL